MTTKRLVRISYFTMLTVIGSLLKLPVPFTPVFFTMQTVFVIMSGFVLGKWDGAYAQIAYMVIGLVGIPIFTNGGGISYIFQPSFGYIFSFFIGAFMAGFVLNRRKKINPVIIFISGLSGLIPIYLIGMAYQTLILALYTGMGWYAALATLPSIIVMFAVDIVMLVIICIIYPRIMTMLKITKSKTATTSNASNVSLNSNNASLEVNNNTNNFNNTSEVTETAAVQVDDSLLNVKLLADQSGEDMELNDNKTEVKLETTSKVKAKVEEIGKEIAKDIAIKPKPKAKSNVHK